MTQPFSLEPEYILEEHCVTAAKKLEKRAGLETVDEAQASSDVVSSMTPDSKFQDVQESSQSSGKPKIARSGPLTQDEIGTEAAEMVYRVITAILYRSCLLYTSPSPRDQRGSRMPSSA